MWCQAATAWYEGFLLKGISMQCFWSRPEIVDFMGLGGPGGPETPYKRWVAKRPTGAARTPRIGDFKNHV